VVRNFFLFFSFAELFLVFSREYEPICSSLGIFTIATLFVIAKTIEVNKVVGLITKYLLGKPSSVPSFFGLFDRIPNLNFLFFHRLQALSFA